MPYELFWHLTPSKLKAFQDADIIRRKRIDEMSWVMGRYIFEALDSTVCNNGLWRKKGSKPAQYPQRPYLDKEEINTDNQTEQKEMTEEEKIRKTKMLFAKLNVMAANSRLDHKNK